jgi:hypothetical protein
MFFSETVTVERRFDVAVSRLIGMIPGPVLTEMSEGAYEHDRSLLVRVGPFGDAVGVSKLVRVQTLEPITRGSDTVVVPLRWEATGPMGDVFPVLDADLTLARDGDGLCTVTLTGTYRPPMGPLGRAADRALMARVARATARSLLSELRLALTVEQAQPTEGRWPEPGLAAD